MKAIVVEEITKEYEGRKVLGPISFEVSEKCIHGFLGPNGAGKSTTFKIIAGLLNSTRGRVIVNGLDIKQNQDTVKKYIGILPENAPLMKEMKVKEFLIYVSRLHGLDKKKAQEQVEKTIEKLSLSEVSNRLISNLSKGYKQRIGIAQAIVFDPKVILLDEPTAGLDPASVIEMRKLIIELKKEHTILFSSHLLHEVEMICDELTIIKEGELVFTGKKEDVLSNAKKSISIEINCSLRDESFWKELKDIEVLHYEALNKENTIWKVTLKGERDSSSKLLNTLLQNKIEVFEFKILKDDLEQAFLNMTEGNKK